MLAIPLGPYELICNLLNPRLAIYKLKIHASVHLLVWVNYYLFLTECSEMFPKLIQVKILEQGWAQ